MHLTTILFLFAATILGISGDSPDLTGCYSNQQLELHHQDTISCQFPSDFLSVYWYENVSRDEVPTLTYKRDKPFGAGYDSGVYDIYPNGSLIIKNVSFHHERVFKVVLYETDDVYHNFRVDCTIKVTSSQKLPHIDGCSAEGSWCFLQPPLPDTINCSFAGARPAAQIQWQRNIGNILENINTSTMDVQAKSDYTFVSRATLSNDSINGSMVLHICKAKQQYNSTWMSKNLLVDSLNGHSSNYIEWEEKYHNIGDRVTLLCTSGNGSFISSWRMIIDGNYDVIGYAINSYSATLQGFASDFRIRPNHALYIDAVRRSHEGKYTCMTSDGRSQGEETRINLIVMVPPTPSYLDLKECPTETNCLTCSVSNIYPEVSLHWTLNGDIKQKHVNSHSNREKNDLFSIQTKLVYYPSEGCQDQTITCHAEGEATNTFSNHITQFIVKAPKQCVLPTSTSLEPNPEIDVQLAVTLTVFVTFVLSIALVAIIIHVYNNFTRQRHHPNDREEMQELMGEEAAQKRPQFIRELRCAYEERLSNCLQTMLNGKVFYIPNDIVHCKPNTSVLTDASRSERLDAFEEMFTDDQLEKYNIIIEANAGLGKSTLTMKMMEQWTTQNEITSVTEFDILIVIELERVKTTQSLSEMIVSLLLPKDTEISKYDVERILKADQARCLIIFEDLDQYKDQHVTNEVQDIMSKNLLMEAKAILFTRPTKSIDILSKRPKRLTLSRFTDSQVHKYIEEYFSDKQTIAHEFGDKLRENSLLMNVCTYPQFLAIATSRCELSPEIRFGGDQEFATLTGFLDELLKSRGLLTNDEVIGKAAFELSVHGTLQTFQVDSKEDDIVQKLVVMGIVYSGRKANKNNTGEVVFRSRLFQQFFGARYLIGRSSQEFDECLNKIEDIAGCEELILFVSGMVKCTPTYKKITKMLLEMKDTYPFPIRDTLFYSLREADILNHVTYFSEMMSTIAQMCQREYGLRIDSADPVNLQKIKAELISLCAVHKIPINTIWLWNVVSKLTAETVHLKCGYSFQMPSCVRTYVIDDMDGNITRDQILYMPKATTELEQTIIYSPKVPKFANHEWFLPMGEESSDSLVFWFTFKKKPPENKPGHDLVRFNYTSKAYRTWMSCEEATVVKSLRMKQEFSEMDRKTRVAKIQAKGVKGYIESYSTDPEAEQSRIRGHVQGKLEHMGCIITELGKVFEARSDEEADKHIGLYQQKVTSLAAKLKLVDGKTVDRPPPVNDLGGNEEDGDPRSLRQLTKPLKDIFKQIRL